MGRGGKFCQLSSNLINEIFFPLRGSQKILCVQREISNDEHFFRSEIVRICDKGLMTHCVCSCASEETFRCSHSMGE